MEPITIDEPAVSKATHRRYVVLTAGTGPARGDFDLLLTSASNTMQAITAARHVLGEHFVVATAFDAKDLRDLANAVEDSALSPGEVLNATFDPNLDACILARQKSHTQTGF